MDFTVRRAYVAEQSYKQQRKANEGERVKLYNWWECPNYLWLRQFAEARGIVPEGKHLNMCSVFGYREVCSRVKQDGPTVFFTTENSHDDPWQYADYLMADVKPDLALGFDMFELPHYMRFPLWITYMFPANATEDDIRKRCAELRYPNVESKEKFASLVARYDWRGTRSGIYHALEHIAPISCPSDVQHNDDSLKTRFNDNKQAYLRQFYFNICPENTNNMGYVTEKAFEAISAGCIPVYWGSMNTPEPFVLNPKAMVLWNMQGDNAEQVKLVEELMANPSMMNDYLHQPRLKDTAEDFVLQAFSELGKRLKNLYD